MPATIQGLLQGTDQQPEVVTTDQASDSDMVFGIFSILGYRFAPRLVLQPHLG
ncbi:MAG TPA: Tn3 family transposase [Actinomycetes bacterium]|jgi:TnpA family transposase|nr:Tn3 family transposase [Actinomycetes bacterium]